MLQPLLADLQGYVNDAGQGALALTLVLCVVGLLWVRRAAAADDTEDEGMRRIMMESRHSRLILPPSAMRELQLRAKKRAKKGRRQTMVQSFNSLVDRMHLKRSVPAAASETPSTPALAYLASDEEGRSATDKIPLPAGCRPLIAFVNSKSGGGQGAELLRSLRSLLNKQQVFDLARTKPIDALTAIKDLERFCVLVCGGDGTVGWVLSVMGELNILDKPVSIMPLGTGNDLARCLDWGGGYEGENVEEILAQVAAGHIRSLDRWKFDIVKGPAYNPTTRWTNYISVGVDAEVAYRFHKHRNRRPYLHFARLVNKIWYFRHGVVTFVTQLYRKAFGRSANGGGNGGSESPTGMGSGLGSTGFGLDLHTDPNKITKTVTLVCDGAPVELPPDTAGVIVSNIGSYGGGAPNLWPGPEAVDMGDGLMEVVAVTGVLHLTQIQLGLASGVNLGQYRTVEITTKEEMKMQIDGEPWIQPPCAIRIGHSEAVSMLCRTVDISGATINTLTDLLEWAEEEGLVTPTTGATLLAELRRRCERQRNSSGLSVGAVGV